MADAEVAQVGDQLARLREAEARRRAGAGRWRAASSCTRRSSTSERDDQVHGLRRRGPSRPSSPSVRSSHAHWRAEALGRHRELGVLVAGVEEQHERVVDDPLAVLVRRDDLLAVEEHAEQARAAVVPVDLASCAGRRAGTTTRRAARSPPRRSRAGTGGGGRRGARARSAISRRVNSSSSPSPSTASQSNQEISLSWHQALLLPPCERPNSSPPSSIGVPWESSSVARKFFCWRARSALISGSSVSPSTPQFQERLSSVPSRLSSRLASLCFSL